MLVAQAAYQDITKIVLRKTATFLIQQWSLNTWKLKLAK